ncbi:hypothetical protein B0T22DRAFT_480431 [Podospora appendiculata]|uniref:Uncharacterized protein n=1 Tax=Podospora appendiculata TaxID=314037 RepID=A0AAE0XB58_9PEZI|nr:hypothetical protein B0T22DRAFT_480431 [Podospora appendiculata]
MSAAGGSPSDSYAYYAQDEFDTPHRTGTDSSHYSCTNLPDDDPVRYLRASEARRQVAELPDKKPRISGVTSKRQKQAVYPLSFKNTEVLTTLQAKTPRREYPIMPTGNWDPTTGKRGVVATRAVYNNADRDVFDIVHHDPTKKTATFCSRLFGGKLPTCLKYGEVLGF